MKFSFQASLLILYLIGAYLNMSLFITETIFIPNFISYFCAICLLLFQVNKSAKLNFIYFFLGIIIISILSIIFSPNLAAGIFKEKLLSFVQLFLSLVSFLAVILTLYDMNPLKVSRILGVFLFILLAGAFLERIIPPIGAISDYFRETVYAFGVYTSEKRDISMVGFVRPNFFSREPSFLAHFIALFAILWHILSRNRYKTSILIFILFFSIVITGSLKILLLVPAFLFLYLKDLKKLILKYHILVFFSFGLFMILFVVSSYYIFSERIIDILSSKDQSFNMRILVPAAVIGFALARYPFFGVGLGAKENSLAIFNDTLTSFGYDWMVRLGYEPNFHSFSLEVIHFYGILGTLLMIYIFNKYLLRTFERVDKYRFWGILLLISMMGGSPFVGVRTWLTVAFLTYSISITDLQNKRREHKS